MNRMFREVVCTIILCSTNCQLIIEGVPVTNLCKDIDCGWGEECFVSKQLQNNTSWSLTPSCRPSCSFVRCPNNYTCLDRLCLHIPSCTNHCTLDSEQCIYVDTSCEAVSCPKYPVCVPVDPTKAHECPNGEFYKDGKCASLPSCENYACKKGEECYLQPLICERREECPPIPVCRIELPPCNCGPHSVCYRGHCISL